MAESSYPLRLDGRIDEPLSRWLWLAKWLLAIPHVVVLLFLWVAVAVCTVVAWFAILFTGRYPRALFDFNVGVLRWTWRVDFYAFSVVATDRYPPFSLASDPGYPADLAVDYPDRLSRGLVLVKSWLLAIPHLLLVGIFAGGWHAAGGGGLIALLSLIAVVILAVRSSYPEALFDLVMGLNRWCYRVMGYVLLMRDEYPPFRLDPGGTDPGHFAQLPAPAPSDSPVGA